MCLLLQILEYKIDCKMYPKFHFYPQQLAPKTTQRTSIEQETHGEILLPGSVQILRLPLHSNRDDGFFRHEPEQFRGNHSEPNVRRVPGECAGSTLGRGDEKVD